MGDLRQVPGAPRLVERPEIVEIAKKLGRTPGQVILRWNLQRGIAVLPKTATPSRLAEVTALMPSHPMNVSHTSILEHRAISVLETTLGYLSPLNGRLKPCSQFKSNGAKIECTSQCRFPLSSALPLLSRV